MDQKQAVENYRQLAAKVDAKFNEILNRYGEAFQCQKGCHSCCQPGLTVSPVEREAIRGYLQSNPDLIPVLQNLEAADPHKGSRCRFLDREGACVIYPVRPLICRSHGAPIAFRASSGGDDDNDEFAHTRDVCPLHFKDEPIADLPDAMVLNIDTVNAILAVVNQSWLQDVERSSQRYELRLAALLAGG